MCSRRSKLLHVPDAGPGSHLRNRRPQSRSCRRSSPRASARCTCWRRARRACHSTPTPKRSPCSCRHQSMPALARPARACARVRTGRARAVRHRYRSAIRAAAAIESVPLSHVPLVHARVGAGRARTRRQDRAAIFAAVGRRAVRVEVRRARQRGARAGVRAGVAGRVVHNGTTRRRRSAEAALAMASVALRSVGARLTVTEWRLIDLPIAVVVPTVPVLREGRHDLPPERVSAASVMEPPPSPSTHPARGLRSARSPPPAIARAASDG